MSLQIFLACLRASITLCALTFTCAASYAGIEDGRAALMRADPVAARAEFEPLARTGDATAQFEFAMLYSYGRGVVEDKKVALEWYTKSANQDYALAQMRVGEMYLLGDGGVAPNKIQAVAWWLIAQKNGEKLSSKLLHHTLPTLSESDQKKAILIARQWRPKP